MKFKMQTMKYKILVMSFSNHFDEQKGMEFCQ